MVTSAWLCRHLMDDMYANPDIPVESMQQLCMERFRLKVKKRLFYKVKAMAKEKIHGAFAESYALLPMYAEIIKSSNPGSYALATWTGSSVDAAPYFKACFFSFAAQVRGFLKGCRPIIGIDGAHLSGYYKGCMLSAVGIDGNNEIFPIAHSVVDVESSESWGYFFRNLRLLFHKGVEKDDWTFISDRMKGVESSLIEVFPSAKRRICCQHLYVNCKNAGYSGTAFHDLFWVAANAYNYYVYNKAIDKIISLDPNAFDYLENVAQQWSRHVFDPAICCDHNTTNFVESYNAVTKPYRDLPLMTLLEAIRAWCMKRIGIRFDKAVDIDPNAVTEYAAKILEERAEESSFCHVTKAGGGEFEVRDVHVLFPIRLDQRTCACGKWQGTGIPCKHGLRVIFYQRLDPKDFVSHYFQGAAYKLTMQNTFIPCQIHHNGHNLSYRKFNLHLSKELLAGHQSKGRGGRFDPKKGKRNSSVKCGKCKEIGHNSRSCKGGKKQRGTASATTTAKDAKTSGSTSTSKGGGNKRKQPTAAAASTSKAAPKIRRTT